MTFKSRISAIRYHLPALRLLILLVFSVAVTWLLVYLRMVDYVFGQGGDPNQIGRGNIALEVLDATTIFFAFLVFVAAGIVPLAILFVRANAARSNVAPIVWAVLIIGLLLLTRTTGQ